MTGLLGLLGGLEHRAGFEELDQRLVAHVVGRRPIVTILPLASSTRKRHPTAALARSWWSRRGAVVGVAPHGTDHDRAVAIRMVRASDLVVLPGGMPDRLHRRLDGSRLWFEVVDAWRRGTSLSGASSGAMVLCGRRQSVLPPFRIGTGLGVLPGVAAAPHLDERALGLYARLRTRLDRELVVLGIDTSTGLVGRDGVFEVLGTGTVRLARHGSMQVRRAGQRLDLNDVTNPGPPVAPRPADTPRSRPVSHPKASTSEPRSETGQSRSRRRRQRRRAPVGASGASPPGRPTDTP